MKSVLLTVALLGAAALPLAAQSLEEAGDTRRAGEAAAVRREIAGDPVAPAVAPKGADVTLVVFSDYQCPYCRRIHPAIEQLKREDRRLRIVYRDWPIFGAPSVEAARTAIAANYQGRHAAFNDALMATQGRIDSAAIRAAAARAGVDWKRLKADENRHAGEIEGVIARTRGYARAMGLTGTPAMLVGRYLIPGAVDLPTLRKAIASARADKTSRAGP
ncbi:DsbA family protein [uncultured Sphingomonas sp.]|uniref:DsbA family protein n=1 Tax=uncultured Sphingomonas sp. TaxID=158754 RepID=UPI0025F75DC8|nr:DsbA family protein [uncultured Sphingomonas sp.]